MLLCYSYIIIDLVSENVYGVRFNLSICLNVSGFCEVYVEVFDEYRFNKFSCNWIRGFVIEGMIIKFI